MLNRIKILFMVPSMRGGGAEKVILILINSLNRCKYDISLTLCQKEGEYLDELPDDIEINYLNAKRVRYSFFNLIKTIWQQKPDIIFTTLGHLNLYIMLVKPLLPNNIKYIARETDLPSIMKQLKKQRKIFDYLYRALYPKFDKIVCQSFAMEKDLIVNYGLSKHIIEIINNPLDTTHIYSQIKTNLMVYSNNKNIINLISAGRLDYIKGFDLLLKALSLINDKKFHLNILGVGEEKHNLKSLVKKLEIDDQVTFIGFQKNPYIYMDQADLFVMSSRHESFPNAVIEAMACGTPVVAFNCPGGISEILINKVNGILVEKIDAHLLSKKIIEATNIKWDKTKIKESVLKKYSLQQIMAKYERLFETWIA